MDNFEIKIFSANGVIQWSIFFANNKNDADTEQIYNVALELKKALGRLYNVNQKSE